MNINTTLITPGKLFSKLKAGWEIKDPLFLHGKPGIGKTEVVREFAESIGAEIEEVHLSSLFPSDIRGLPYINEAAKKVIWYLPDFLPDEDDETPRIIFLDELTTAEQALQAACYQLILDRKVGRYRLPANTWVIAAGNPADSGAIHHSMGTALADRLTHYNVICSPEEWIEWAKDKVHTNVLIFIRAKPEYIDDRAIPNASDHTIVPSPRSWVRVSDYLNQNLPEDEYEAIISGRIGKQAYIQYNATLDEIKNLPDMVDVYSANDKTLMSMLRGITTISGLYGLVYSLASYASPEESAIRRGMYILNKMVEIKDTINRKEVRTLGMNLLMERCNPDKNGGISSLYLKVGMSPEYKEYQEEAEAINHRNWDAA